MPGDAVPDTGITIPHFDKLVHAVMFAGVAFLVYALLEKSSRLQAIIWSFTISVLYGGIIEILQPLLFNRGCEFADWIADIVGAALAVWIAPWGIKWMYKLFAYINIKE